MSVEGMGPSLAVEGSTTREVFETYLRRVLAPSLRPGQVVVMDNLSSHKGAKVRELIEERGCELLYLPPYSPDFNPIEEAFAKVKGLLRRFGARSREALIEAMGRALDAVTAEDARGFFEHCSYIVSYRANSYAARGYVVRRDITLGPANRHGRRVSACSAPDGPAPLRGWSPQSPDP